LTLERESARLEDPGAQLLDSISSRWERYGRMLLIGLGVIAVIAIGVFFTLRTRAADEEQAAGKLAEANLYFWQGAYDRSLPIARQVSEQWPNSPSGIDAHRLAGDDQFWLGKFKESVAEYRLYLAKQKSGLIADAVRRSLAYALESDLQFKEAASVYEGLVGRFDRESSAEFLYAAARCYRQLNQPKEADQMLKRLLDEYGETSNANRARMLRAELAAAPR
jgi:tetratricopeptide (TPR) repeat protein